jgi:phosphoserine phosphatase RsbU/P
VLAGLFAVATTVYAGTWMYGVRLQPPAYLGISFEPDPGADDRSSILVSFVKPGSPAERSGLRSGDRILRLDGRPVGTRRLLRDAMAASPPGTPVELEIQRGETRVSLHVALEPAPAEPSALSRRVVDELLRSYPILFLVVGLGVLILRPEDRDAWLLALVFGGFIAAAPFIGFEDLLPPPLARLGLLYKFIMNGISPALFLFFFSVFPERSALDRSAPWLKWTWLVAGLMVAVPVGLWVAIAGRSAPALAIVRPMPPLAFAPAWIYAVGGYLLGLASLIRTAVHGSVTSRRKSRVIVWGTVVGYTPTLSLFVVATARHQEVYELPFWIWAPCIMGLLLLPLSFAYAVLKHRILELPVLLKKSARYVLVQRGFVVMLSVLGVGTTLLFASQVPSHVQAGSDPHLPVAVTLGAAFGTLLVWAGSHLQRRIGERIDRAFFRSAYDVRHILQDLAERARSATSRSDLATLIGSHVRSALQPSSLTVYLESADGRLEALGPAPPDRRLLLDLDVLTEVARRGQPWELRPDRPGDLETMAALAPLEPDCLVPVLGRDGQVTGLLVLGPRLSEDPYSGEDKSLLASVANQAGIALDSVRLAEQVAERLEVERRAAHEMELARAVQGRFLPSEAPELATLEYAGRCVQARAVGGDYFDFLDLGPGRVGLVLADISGKGFPAALLMANLQASLRSRSARDMLDPAGQLRSVNQLLYRSSESNRFATLFLGIYDDASRQLCYANCGHNPPILLRAGGAVERLAPTAPVLGLLLERWECATVQFHLASGDLLSVFSDGITEAFSDEGEEYGEERLIAALRAGRDRPVEALIDELLERVRVFSGAVQEDDETLVVARGL